VIFFFSIIIILWYEDRKLGNISAKTRVQVQDVNWSVI